MDGILPDMLCKLAHSKIDRIVNLCLPNLIKTAVKEMTDDPGSQMIAVVCSPPACSSLFFPLEP